MANQDFIFQLQRFVNITNTDSDSLLAGTNYNDSIVNFGNNVSISAGNGFDTITNRGNTVIITAEAGKDSVQNFGNNVQISTGDDEDIIYTIGRNSVVLAGAGDDSVRAWFAHSSTITGGAGNDTIDLEKSKSSYVVYNYGDGQDTISNFDSDDTLAVTTTHNYSTLSSNGDIFIIFDSGNNIFLKNVGTNITAANIQITGGNLVSSYTTNIINVDAVTRQLDNVNINSALVGTNYNDSIKNSGSLVTISTGEGLDTVSNSGNLVMLDTGAGRDSIKNTGHDVTISTGDGNNTVSNYKANNTSIVAGEGDDSIHSDQCNFVTINAGAGNDSVKNIYGSDAVIFGGDGKDTIYNDFAASSSIVGGAGDDSIYNYKGDNATITGGAGNDTINLDHSKYNYVLYNYGDGEDTISNFDSDDFLMLNTAHNFSTLNDNGDLCIIFDEDNSIILKKVGADTSNLNINVTGGGNLVSSSTAKTLNVAGVLSNVEPNKVIIGTNDGDSIANSGNLVSISSGEGLDTVSNSGSMVTINTGAGNDTVWSSGNNVTINTGDGRDSLYNYLSSEVSISTGDGSDRIHNFSSNNVTINAGGGYDSINNYNGDYVTIIGGTGNDTINLDHAKFNHIFYRDGDGIDNIFNLDADDTLELITSQSYSTVQEGRDLHINFDESNSIILKDFGTDTSLLNIVVTAPTSANTFASRVAARVAKVNGVYSYTGGSANISNYLTGDKLNYAADDFTGIDYHDTEFILQSSSGSLTVQNALDKIINVEVGGNTVAYAFMASGGGKLDGSSFSQLEFIIGGEESANAISAGIGGSTLWGGIGGNDTLTGGAGTDIFFYGKYDGTDIINNAGASDIVNLYNLNLSDILSANISGRTISASFTGGGNLQINSSENVSATFKLADGNFKYNHSSGTWQSA